MADSVSSLLKQVIKRRMLIVSQFKVVSQSLNCYKNLHQRAFSVGLSHCSDEQVSEVCVHDFVLLLLHLGVGVIWRENQVNLSSQRVDADHPEVTRIHLLLQAVGVLDELLMQLAQDQL